MIEEIKRTNIEQLQKNKYPGRGIIIGLSPDSQNYIQVYWIMGRSENSRNRLFMNENGCVKTEAYDRTKLIDPSLIIYYPVKNYRNTHIVSNGDQTDTIFNGLLKGESFVESLNKREFEPDEPNYTPRISGILDLDDTKYAYKLSILKSFYNNPKHCIRHLFQYERGIPGIGHCLHTYQSELNPLSSFQGEPYIVDLFDDIDQVGEFYWDLLNQENKISLMVKFINIENKNTSIKIINKYHR